MGQGKIRLRKAIGPRLATVFALLQGLFALLVVNSVYLVGVRLMEWRTGQVYQNWFYMNMFLVHLVMGLALMLPLIAFIGIHLFNTHNRPNRRAVYVGYALALTSLALVASGIVLTRLEGIIVVKDPAIRQIAWWVHVVSPLVITWLFVLHRLAGRPIRWKIGLRWAAVAAVFGAVMLVWQAQDPRSWNQVGPASGEQYFQPSLARTSSGDFIPEHVLDNDAYCAECHQDSHASWAVSAHRFASFNNPAYLFSVRETRRVAFERDGDLQAARFCAGCHDPVVFFSGKFDDPDFDDVSDPAGQAGITCTSCHAITHVNSVRGNSDFTIEEPIHYPFAFSQQPALAWVNRQLVKAKPDFHKRTFLKPLHQTTEFCGTCHKVFLPEDLNDYKWLRGQNHYDAFLLSGVSGHGVTSFYYPQTAETSCNDCHMPLAASDQFAARDFDGQPGLEAHDHQFPSANTGLLKLLADRGVLEAEGQDLDTALEAHRAFNEGVMRVDLFGIREGGTITGTLRAPLGPELPTLEPGASYLLETVVRTLKMGHVFTQGTADSNQVWLDLRVTSGDRVIGRSGGLDARNRVDPWAHFLNAYVLDREGRRIDRRNAQDIFVALYDHQIPPGAADAIHYRLDLPEDLSAPVEIEARLQYRKFDTTYMEYVHEDPDYVNDLPVMTLAEDRLVLPVAGVDGAPITNAEDDDFPLWQRWNDYGIGLLRKGGKSKGQLRQAEEAFARVEELGRPDGPLNLARVYLNQGTVQGDAIDALQRAAAFDPPAPAWSVAWFTGLVNKQNGFLDEAIANFESILALDTEETRRRGFDFSKDYRLLDELGQTYFERAKQERGEARAERRRQFLTRATELFETAIELDPENVSAHYNLDLIYRQLGQEERAEVHRALHAKYKPDDNARDRAVAAARAADPAADHAAEAIVVYDLRRPDAYELEGLSAGDPRRSAPYELRAIPGEARTEPSDDRTSTVSRAAAPSDSPGP